MVVNSNFQVFNILRLCDFRQWGFLGNRFRIRSIVLRVKMIKLIGGLIRVENYGKLQCRSHGCCNGMRGVEYDLKLKGKFGKF